MTSQSIERPNILTNDLLNQHAKDVVARRASLDPVLLKIVDEDPGLFSDLLDHFADKLRTKQEWRHSSARRLQIGMRYNLRRLLDPTWR